MRPRIGITCRYQIRTTPGGVQAPDVSVDARFGDRIMEAGGLPLLIPHSQEDATLKAFMEMLDAVILTGGPDVPPERYGAAPDPQTVVMHDRRADSDFRVIRMAEQRGMPLLAICLGIQEWNVARGGTLHQHVPDLGLTPAIAHRDGTEFAFHPVRLAAGSLIHSIVRISPLPVNSSHHQALARLGEGLEPVAWADDGIVEAVQDRSRPFALGLQWHPEDLPDDPLQRRIFEALVTAAKNRGA